MLLASARKSWKSLVDVCWYAMLFSLSAPFSMRKMFPLFLCLLLVLVPMLSAAEDGDLVPKPKGIKIPGQYIVMLKDGADAAAIANEITAKNKGKVSMLFQHVLHGMTVKMDDMQAMMLRFNPNVEGVFQDEEVTMFQSTQGIPTGIDRVNAENKTNKGTGVEVAVLDTGIDTTHPDLAANILGGKNCSTGTSFEDGNGHGTHVAGTIAALDNGVGVVGVAPEAKLWAVRVLDNNGSGSWSSVICGIDWVTANASHIKIASMSLGGGGSAGSSCNSSPLRKAICNAVNAGVTFIVAAGNDGRNLSGFVPAAFPEVIVVSALGDSDGKPCGLGPKTRYSNDDAFASFSNYASSSTDKARLIGAPGVSIKSTWKGGLYNTISGTSMATPHVSGAAALYIKTNTGATPVQVKNALFAVAEKDKTNMNGECTGTKKSHTGDMRHAEPVLRADAL